MGDSLLLSGIIHKIRIFFRRKAAEFKKKIPPAVDVGIINTIFLRGEAGGPHFFGILGIFRDWFGGGLGWLGSGLGLLRRSFGALPTLLTASLEAHGEVALVSGGGR